jgi:hypothetical protein
LPPFKKTAKPDKIGSSLSTNDYPVQFKNYTEVTKNAIARKNGDIDIRKNGDIDTVN